MLGDRLGEPTDQPLALIERHLLLRKAVPPSRQRTQFFLHHRVRIYSPSSAACPLNPAAMIAIRSRPGQARSDRPR
jgi:hypothetical protein